MLNVTQKKFNEDFLKQFFREKEKIDYEKHSRNALSLIGKNKASPVCYIV